MMRDFEPLPDSIPQNLRNVTAKALAKQSQNRYQTTGEMREDLRRVSSGETVADFIQTDSRQNFAAEEVTQIRKSAPFSAQNSKDENETVIRSAPSFGQSEKRKSSNVWMYATLGLVLVGAIGLGFYFLVNQPKQNNSNRNEIAQILPIQSSNNSVNVENTNTATNANIVLDTPTPIPALNKTQVQKIVNSYISSKIKSLSKTSEYPMQLLNKSFIYGDIDNDSDEDVIALISF